MWGLGLKATLLTQLPLAPSTPLSAHNRCFQDRQESYRASLTTRRGEALGFPDWATMLMSQELT